MGMLYRSRLVSCLLMYSLDHQLDFRGSKFKSLFGWFSVSWYWRQMKMRLLGKKHPKEKEKMVLNRAVFEKLGTD